MKSAGVDRSIAVIYGKHPIDRALFDGIKRLDWVAGSYHIPTDNLFRISRRGRPNALLTGRLQPDQLLRDSNPNGWDRVCAKYQLPRWLEKAKALVGSYGIQLFYFDTLAVQLASCLSPSHPSSIEENQQARLEIMEKTRNLGTVVGTGKAFRLSGRCRESTFEGLMSLRTYSNTHISIPAGGYETDLGASYASDAAVALGETRRIPFTS